MARDSLFKLRRDVAATWTSVNPILGSGEPGIETDTLKMKIGDGVTHWTSLGYFNGGGPAADTQVWMPLFDSDGAVVLDDDEGIVPTLIAIA
jgi:hypothetical protein